jgi:hypothetical protein
MLFGLGGSSVVIITPSPLPDEPRRTFEAAHVPWPVTALLVASTCVVVGVLWDISWHQTIGRDTFWTPAHVAIYVGGAVAGISCGWLALRTTFRGTPRQRAETVRFWGFHAPIGAWVGIWGAFAMLTSAPFDNWWHGAYGLDVKILSPPHAVLASGIGAIQVGAMLIALAWQNRTRERSSRIQLLFLYGAALLLLNTATLVAEYIHRWNMHRSLFYQIVGGVFPFLLVSAARASAARWPATAVATVYMAVSMLMVWILPLFEGRPLLGPIYVQVERFVPPDPPLLLIAPAVAIDVLLRWLVGRDWVLAAALACAFLALFFAVQWPFADFLMSPLARNWVFGTHHVAYMVPPPVQARWFQLNVPDNLAAGLPVAAALAFASARCGLWWGTWMSRVQR